MYGSYTLVHFEDVVLACVPDGRAVGAALSAFRRDQIASGAGRMDVDAAIDAAEMRCGLFLTDDVPDEDDLYWDGSVAPLFDADGVERRFAVSRPGGEG